MREKGIFIAIAVGLIQLHKTLLNYLLKTLTNTNNDNFIAIKKCNRLTTFETTPRLYEFKGKISIRENPEKFRSHFNVGSHVLTIRSSAVVQ